MTIVACIQLNSSDDIAENIAQVEPLAREAVARGATFLALPENAFAMRREGQKASAFATHEHEGVRWAQEFCASRNVSMLIGSIRALKTGQDKPVNQSVLIDAAGVIAATYDKMHLFDVTLPDGTRYEESMSMAAGSELVMARTPFAMLGLSICYDVRFPAMYRQLAQSGAEILCVPSAFTRPTGKAHWETLLRARAIENLAYVVAPAQGGVHAGGRQTYGHSMIIDPWGEVLAVADGEQPQVITESIDVQKVTDLRAQFPVLMGD